MMPHEIINFVAVRPPFVVYAQALCDVFNEHQQGKQGIVVNDTKALQEDDVAVLLMGYTEVDLVAAEALQRELLIRPSMFIVVNVPKIFSLAEILRHRAQKRLGGKIMEMPNEQESIPAFAQSLFNNDFFRTPEASIIAKIHDSVKDVL